MISQREGENRRDDRNDGRDNRGNQSRRRELGPREHFPQNIFPFPQQEILYLQDGVIRSINRSGLNALITVVQGAVEWPAPDQLITLVITANTVLRNQSFAPIRVSDLSVGMTISAAYSSRFTRSIPPQAVAFSIIASTEESFAVSNGTITNRNDRNRTITIGNRNNPHAQLIIHVTEETEIFGLGGSRVRFDRLRIGDLVRVEHATFQTASIPPQTTAYRIYLMN